MESLDSYALQLSTVNSENLKHGSWFNNFLDQLNSLDQLSFNCQGNLKKTEHILNQCISLVSPKDTFLVAKCCQLMLKLLRKPDVPLEKPLLNTFVPWCIQALQESADLALIDILQALQAVIHSSTANLETVVGDLIGSLSFEVESRASLTAPLDVRVWRIQCLTALAPAITAQHRAQYITSLWNILQHSPRLDCDGDAQVIKFVLEAVEVVARSDDAWLSDVLGDVLDVVVVYLHFGLPGWQHKPPSRLFPLPGAQWEPPPAPNIKSKTKRGHKKRVSNIASKDVEEEGEEVRRGPGYMAAPTRLAWATSDSEVSDSEGGRSRRLRSTQARVRLAAINLLVHVAKTINIRDLFGYYSVLVGSQGLAHSLLSDSNPRLNGIVASTLAFLLGNAKTHFAQAQHSSITSYTPFSSVLASLLDNLHQCVVRALSASPSMPLLNCAACLAEITPYHRLQPGLLPPLLSASLPLINHREVIVSVAAITLLGCVVAIDPQTEEIQTLITSSKPPVTLPEFSQTCDKSWILSACLKYLQGDNQKAIYISTRVEWWQVLANMLRFHFDSVRSSVDDITAVILRDVQAPSEHVRIHALRTLQHLTTSLGVLESDQRQCTQIWTTALQFQLLGLVGDSPLLASAVCDCLAALNPATFQQLSEKLQICCITSLLCCAKDEDAFVRAAAVHALAAFLNFPTLSQDEQFVYDCSDVISRLLKDPIPLVSGKAAWALGNLTDMLYKNQHGEELLPPIQLINMSMETAQGKPKVKANGLRALGNLLGLLKPSHLSLPEYENVPLNAARVLIKNATSSNNMKISWNACYALSSMLKNEAIHQASSSWQGEVVVGLCSLVVRSSNFKVRTNACSALASLPTRLGYGPHFLTAWKSVVESLTNAQNTTDFKEVKHQDDLLQQLCLTLCHLASLVELADLSSLHELIVYHLDTMQQHMCRFLSSAVPERTDAVLRAASNIAQLQASTMTQRDALTILSDVFTFGV